MTIPYIENPKNLGKILENSLIKHNHQLLKVISSFNARIDLVVPSLAEVKQLRDELAEKHDDSPDDWRRWNEIDSYYTMRCINGITTANGVTQIK